MQRTTNPYPTIADVSRGYDEAFAIIDPWRKRKRKEDREFRFGFVYDVRNPPQRSDPDFERVHHEYRPKLYARSPALVVLVRTLEGKAQMRRLGHLDGSRFYATDDPDEAIRLVFKTLDQHRW